MQFEISGVRTAFPPPLGLSAWPPARDWTWALWVEWLTLAGWTPEQIDWYQWAREQYSVPLQYSDGRREYLYRPGPRQALFHHSSLANLLYGGAVGGMKSHSLRWHLYLRALHIPEYHALLMRRTWPELEMTHLVRINRDVTPLGWSAYKDRIDIPQTGGIIRFGHCEHKGDEERYLGAEYDDICVDELVTFLRVQAAGIWSRGRSTKPGVSVFTRSSSNPGGPQTLWVMDYFIHKNIQPEDDPYYTPEDWGYLSSRLFDNPFLMDPDGTWNSYIRRMGPLPPERRRQLLMGDWAAISGQYFSELTDAHFQPATLPPGTSVFLALDWGYSKPGCCVWFAWLPDGHLHVAMEYVFRQTIIRNVARTILRLTRERGWVVKYTVADTQMFGAPGETGETMAHTFAREGLRLRPASKDRELGWQRVRAWLAPSPDTRPWLTFDPECRYLRRTLPALVSDEHNPEDVDSDGDDHGADALRYGLMSRPFPTPHADPPEPIPGTTGWIKQEMARRKAPYAR